MSTARLTTNPVTDKLGSGRPALGSWLTFCAPAAAESMAQIGWDWLVVDVEHSPVGFETMVSCFRAIQLGGAAPLARVPWNDTIWIQRTLDAGAMGLVVPMVNTAEEARAVVANMRYATAGQRSYGGSRLAAYIAGDYRSWADAHLAVIVMIETAQAVANAEAILAVEGVSGCFIGPNPELEAAMQAVLGAARRTGKAAGKHCFTADEVSERIGQGFQFLALASDAAFMQRAAQADFSAITRGGAGGEGKSGLY